MRPKLLKQRLTIIVGILIVSTTFGCQQNVAVSSEEGRRSLVISMYQKYATEFPLVEGISVEDLQQRQQQGNSIVLVDVRPSKERKVSMIPGAISLAEFEDNLDRYGNSNATIVAYCTIGYRSGKYVQKLKQRGIDILNLEGSLLAWSHAQGELVNDAGSTNKLHVFNHQWQLTADNYQPVW